MKKEHWKWDETIKIQNNHQNVKEKKIYKKQRQQWTSQHVKCVYLY